MNEAYVYKNNYYYKISDAFQDIYDDNNNTFVHYSTINKLGINPQSGFSTPLGIYAYPLYYILKLFGRKNLDRFAQTRKYAHVFTPVPTANVIHIHPFSSSYEGINYLSGFPDAEEVWERVKKDYSLSKHGNYSVLWLTAKELANHNPFRWNFIFRKMNIDGFVDHDTGTIHRNEPTQSVFFSKSSIESIVSFDQEAEAKKDFKPSSVEVEVVNDFLFKWFKYKLSLLAWYPERNFRKNIAYKIYDAIRYVSNIYFRSNPITKKEMLKEIKKFIKNLDLSLVHPAYKKIYKLIFDIMHVFKRYYYEISKKDLEFLYASTDDKDYRLGELIKQSLYDIYNIIQDEHEKKMFIHDPVDPEDLIIKRNKRYRED